MSLKFIKSENGFTQHMILPVVVVLAIAGVGTYVLAKSKAASISTDASPIVSSVSSITKTPLEELTSIITRIETGGTLNVTAESIVVPGPISNAKARPIVFSTNGQKYFAYTQGTAPIFSTTPAVTASTMALVKATSNPSVVQAHLDKSSNLVDINLGLVGYSTGGN